MRLGDEMRLVVRGDLVRPGRVDALVVHARKAWLKGLSPRENRRFRRPITNAGICEDKRGTRLAAMTRHVLGLFRGVPGARAFRRHLATEAVKPGAGVDVLLHALSLLERGAELRQAAA
jgi:tRNA-dihydrouridine synthase